MKRILALEMTVLLMVLCACAAPVEEDAVYVPPEERLVVPVGSADSASLRSADGEELFQLVIPDMYAIAKVKFVEKCEEPETLVLNVSSYTFKLQSCLKGNLDEREFIAYAGKHWDEFFEFKPGYSYVIMLTHANTVYEGEAYMLQSPYFLVGNNDAIQDYAVQYIDRSTYEIPVKNIGQLKKYIRKYNDNSDLKQNGPTIGNGYVKSDKLGDIVAGSTYIVKGRITQALAGHAAAPYYCQPVEEYRGHAAQEFHLNAMRGTRLNIGEEYLLLLQTLDIFNEAGEPDYAAVAAQTGCIIPLSDEARVNEVMELIGK